MIATPELLGFSTLSRFINFVTGRRPDVICELEFINPNKTRL